MFWAIKLYPQGAPRDVKIISDLTALPQNIYDNIKHNPNIPINEFNIIDVKTRTRFTAYWLRPEGSTLGVKKVLVMA